MLTRIHRNFHQEKIFATFIVVKFFSRKFLSCVNDYMEDMVTFTALVKIYSPEYFCNTKVAGLGEIFVEQKFSHIR